MTKNQIKTSISLDRELLETARKTGINISKACADGLRQEIYDYQKYQESKKKKQ